MIHRLLHERVRAFLRPSLALDSGAFAPVGERPHLESAEAVVILTAPSPTGRPPARDAHRQRASEPRLRRHVARYLGTHVFRERIGPAA